MAVLGQAPPSEGAWDFGDAPDPGFPSLLASDGARTIDPTPFWLGDLAGAPTTLEPDALVVDLDAADDGLVSVLATAGSIAVTFRVSRSPTAEPGTAWFNLLADSDGSGTWTWPAGTRRGEWVVVNRPVDIAPGASEDIPATVPLVGGNLAVWLRAAVTDAPVTGGDWQGTGEFA